LPRPPDRDARKQERSFLKKRTKKLFPPGTHLPRERRMPTDKSLFASFSSEKEDSSFLP
jgi:hypothetical protein